MIVDTLCARWLKLSWVAGTTLLLAGCATGPSLLHCDDDACGPEPGSQEWWEQKASLPVGARQKYYKGKLWPPFPRPTGEQQQFSHMYHHNHYWPQPYMCQDRAYVRGLINEHVAGGWINATTFYEYHFDMETNELRGPGRVHLRWVLKETPDSRRMVFVQSSDDPEITQTRMDSVRAEAIKMVGDTNLPPIMVRDTTTPGRPAVEVSAIRSASLQSMPAPRISGGAGISSGGLAVGGTSTGASGTSGP